MQATTPNNTAEVIHQPTAPSLGRCNLPPITWVVAAMIENAMG
jgi:hypothetical protein